MLFLLALTAEAAAAPKPSPVGVFVDLEWRGNALADHLSHGPGLAAGATLLDDHLRVGFAAFARPGPVNPATFPVDVAYKGEESVQLRSDGGITGLLVAPGVRLGPVRLDAPLMVGYGGFGFYLHGEDRETPDGRKPSAWENELLDGRDSSFGVGLEGGLRATWRASEHVQPYVAARYTTVLGYDAFVRPDYDGASVALGVSVGAF